MSSASAAAGARRRRAGAVIDESKNNRDNKVYLTHWVKCRKFIVMFNVLLLYFITCFIFLLYF